MSAECYRFEDFCIDPAIAQLRRGDRVVPLEPQVLDLALFLVRNRDRVLNKDELIAVVWRGRIVSDSTVTSRIASLRRALGDDGERQRLVRTMPRKGYRFIGDVRVEPRTGLGSNAPDSPSGAVAKRSVSGKSALAILPFDVFGPHPTLRIWIDSVVEDLITALAQFPWLSVVARRASFRYRDGAVDMRTAGDDLGARYALEGSVREAAEGVRLTMRLVDVAAGVQLWGDSFDGRMDATFGQQDRVVACLLGSLWPQLERAEVERVQRERELAGEAVALSLRGMGLLYLWSRPALDAALELFLQAVEADASFAPAYGMAAYCYVQRKSYGWFDDPRAERAACVALARRAADLGAGDTTAVSRAAHALAYVAGDLDGGMALGERARRLGRNVPLSWYSSGWTRIFNGEPELALADFSTALCLSPLDPLAFKVHAGMAYARLFVGRYDEAAREAEQALGARPDYLTALRAAAASHALAGRVSASRAFLERMSRADPRLRLGGLAELLPLRRPEDLARFQDGLARAGLRE